MKRVAILGGGIAGLSAAFYLEKARRGGSQLEWTLFEQSNRLGGVIRTEYRDGFVLEAGPDSFLTVKPDGAQLCRELGIGDQLIGSNDAERKTYIVVHGRLTPLPDGLQFMVPTRIRPMVTTPLFSWGTKLRMATEIFSQPRVEQADESVAAFVRRHFGQEMVDRVAEPLLAGVYGGDAESLSMRAVLSRFLEMEREHGSLVRATLRARRSQNPRGSQNQKAVQNRSETGAKAPAQPLFTSLKKGMQQLVDALTAQLPANSIRLGERCISLRRSGEEWVIEYPGGRQRYDTVLMAVPAPVAADLLRPVQGELAELLVKIQYTSSVAVALAYDHVGHPPGHGLLVPRSEGRKLMACTFVHKKFSHRAPEGSSLLRCFISSSRLPDVLTYSEDALRDIALEEMKGILGIQAAPKFIRIFRSERGLPQYLTGHLDRVAVMEKRLADLPGCHIIGNSFYGVGVPDCIRSARLAVEKVTSSVLQPASV
jgi:oxygen-dependent protoporphyrinogen oxidase